MTKLDLQILIQYVVATMCFWNYFSLVDHVTMEQWDLWKHMLVYAKEEVNN